MAEIQDMTPYYRERAPLYDAVYSYPERQADLRFLESHVPGILRGHRVLEVAAGTGYWTQFISRQAKSILATDREPAQLEELARRDLLCPVEARVLDAYHLDRLADEAKVFSAAFAGLWLSHVPRQRMNEFFCALHQCLRPGAVVVLMDNSSLQCERFPISHEDEWRNTYQQRCLASGNCYSVLKNFPTLDELQHYTAPFGEFKNYIDLENFWLFQYVSTR